MYVPHRQTTHEITRNERSHATDSHAKNMYITHIYTQARQEYDNRDEYLVRIACSMIIKIIYNQENQSYQDEWDKQKKECTCQGEQNNHGKSRINQYHQHANVTNGYSNQA